MVVLRVTSPSGHQYCLQAICDDAEHAQSTLVAWLSGGGAKCLANDRHRLRIGDGWKVSVEPYDP